MDIDDLRDPVPVHPLYACAEALALLAQAANAAKTVRVRQLLEQAMGAVVVHMLPPPVVTDVRPCSVVDIDSRR